MRQLPIHLLIDFIVDDPTLLRHPTPGMAYLREAVLAGGATVLSEQAHQFEPGGYTGFLLLAQSHATIHTWPEDELVSIDVFACGTIDPDVIIDHLRRLFRPRREHVERRERGDFPPEPVDAP